MFAERQVQTKYRSLLAYPGVFGCKCCESLCNSPEDSTVFVSTFACSADALELVFFCCDLLYGFALWGDYLESLGKVFVAIPNGSAISGDSLRTWDAVCVVHSSCIGTLCGRPGRPRNALVIAIG